MLINDTLLRFTKQSEMFTGWLIILDHFASADYISLIHLRYKFHVNRILGTNLIKKKRPVTLS